MRGGGPGALLGMLMAVLSAPARAAAGSAFPEAEEVFRRLLADPRQIQTSLRYYRAGGQDLSDVALGNTWGLWRWDVPGGACPWTWQLDVAGMAYSRFRLARGVNEFQTIDFFADLPVEVRRGRLSSRVALFHESSHLGDDYIRRTGDQGFRYSVEGLQALLSFDPHELARVYGGGAALLHGVPEGQHGTLQAGFELRSRKFARQGPPCWLYLAQDVQWLGRERWNPDSKTTLGVRFGVTRVVRAMRAHAGYFTGRSTYGQFLHRSEDYWDFGLSFEF